MVLRREWVNGDDFIKVSPDLTRELGGDFVAAGVAARIQFRMNYFGYDRDDARWWRCSMPELAHDMGLSEKQVRRALGVLENADMIAKENHNKDTWDRTLSYRLVFDEVTASAPEGAPSAPQGGSTSAQ